MPNPRISLPERVPKEKTPAQLRLAEERKKLAAQKKEKKHTDPTKPTYLRAYAHEANHLNKGKAEAVLALFSAYIHDAKTILNQQLTRFFTTGKLDKFALLESDKLGLKLSARYAQTCQAQVVAMLSSWIALRQDDLRRIVVQSTIDEAMRKELLGINAKKAWFVPSTKFDAEAMRFAQNIMRALFKQHRLPTAKQINLSLDEKVATIEKSNKILGENPFAYWLKLSTTDKGKPIYLPVKDNPYCASQGGKQKPFVQLNLSKDTGLSVAIIKEFTQKDYTPKCASIGLDVGLKVMFATSQGDLLGKSLYDKLLKLDKQIQGYAAERQRQKLAVRTPRYDRLVSKMRGLLECELNRMLNTLVDRVKPAEIILEDLDFRNQNLSRRMNRLLSNFGRGIVKEKLQALHEEYGIAITFVPAAYTSQSCPHCHHTEKKNRSSRDLFECKNCGFSRHADIVGALNIQTRRSWPEMKVNEKNYLSREAVRSYLLSKHHRWCFQANKVRKECSSRKQNTNRRSKPSSGRRSAPCLLQPPSAIAS